MRLQWVDALRGLAIVLMVVFHFCYDLSYYQLVSFDFYRDAFWLNFRTFILGLFLFVAGISLWLANSKTVNWQRSRRRLLVIAANALLITIATWYMFSERFIFFGVLHFIVLASLVGLIFIRYYTLLLFLAFVMLLAGQYEFSWFDDSKWRQAIGLMTFKPGTEDYVPLLPWLGMVFAGMFFIQWLRRHCEPCMQFKPVALLQPLALLGQYSLPVYMLHQPVLMGVLWLFTRLSF
ncbi:MAG: heparan-alpha-glucosaminide N-acetyltransferase [Gammaproteobacteria bacterium]